MSHLLDVSFLLACAWETHERHGAARAWLEKQASFATCTLSQLGFLRVSLTPAFRATFADAQAALADILERRGTRFLADDVPITRLSSYSIVTHADVTDAYLIELSRAHHLKLATLDDALCAKKWAAATAVNPL